MSNFLRVDLPLLVVVFLSLITGLVMVVVFRYTSDQRAIRWAKDRLKAHLLAVLLFQDQLGVVLRSYARILGGTGHYLRLAFKPLLFVIVPMTFLIVQLDRYLGEVPVQTGQAFLVKARLAKAASLDGVSLQLPPEMRTTAPPVHVPADNEVIWRVVAAKEGRYDIDIGASGKTFTKQTVVSSGWVRLSPVRLRGRWWERFFVSGETALPENGAVESIRVMYSDRLLRFAWLEWSWIWLFFVLSILAGFFFKTVLGIEV